MNTILYRKTNMAMIQTQIIITHSHICISQSVNLENQKLFIFYHENTCKRQKWLKIQSLLSTFASDRVSLGVEKMRRGSVFHKVLVDIDIQTGEVVGRLYKTLDSAKFGHIMGFNYFEFVSQNWIKI